jgi:hypothetical protein
VKNKRRRLGNPGEPLGPRLRRGLGGVGAALVRGSRPALKATAAIAIGAAIIGGGLYAHRVLTQSPRFAITEIRSPLLERLTPAELERALGIKVGDNLIAVSLQAGEQNLSALPWVKSVRLRRELPHALAVDLVERKPAGLVSLGGPLYLVEKDGVPFKRATLAETEGLPVITGIARDRYKAVPEAAHALIRQALEVGARYSENARRPPLGEIHADPLYGFELETAPRPNARGAGSTRIYVGRVDPRRSADGQVGELEAKLHRLDLVLGSIGAEGAATIRLDNATRPDRVTCKLASL